MLHASPYYRPTVRLTVPVARDVCQSTRPRWNQFFFLLVNGAALGGSTRINQMLYTRCVQREYDMWAESGCEGWAWKNVEPYFKKSEKSLEKADDPGRHGKDGN